MILDNADNAELFFPSAELDLPRATCMQTQRPLSDYLPSISAPQKSLLVATRSRLIGEDLAHGESCVEVAPLPSLAYGVSTALSGPLEGQFNDAVRTNRPSRTIFPKSHELTTADFPSRESAGADLKTYPHEPPATNEKTMMKDTSCVKGLAGTRLPFYQHGKLAFSARSPNDLLASARIEEVLFIPYPIQWLRLAGIC